VWLFVRIGIGWGLGWGWDGNGVAGIWAGDDVFRLGVEVDKNVS